jgi:type I restriction enzyme S subunit
MAGEWQTIPLGEFVTLQRGHDLPEEQRRPGGVPILGSFGITGWHDEAKASGPGVTVGRSGASFGVVSYSSVDYWPLNTALYVIDFHGNDPRFAYYFLGQFDFRRFNSGSAQPSLNRNFIHPAPVIVPPLDEQRAIAELLSALDDKIELNRRMAETLEAMARALFLSWFIDFDPVRAKAEARPTGLPDNLAALFPDRFDDDGLPLGWLMEPLSQIAHFLNGLALQKYPAKDGEPSLPVIKIAELRSGSTARSDRASVNLPAEYHVNDGDHLFSWSGSLTHCRWTHGPGALNQHLFKVTPAGVPDWLVYEAVEYHLPEFREIASGKAVTMGHIQRHHLEEAMVALPPKPLLKTVDAVMTTLPDRSFSLGLQSRTLSALRDTLLPRLISGELRITDAEKSISAA